MCYPLEKSSGFEGRVNEVGDGLVAKLCRRSKVIARNGAVAMDELSGRAMFVGPLSLCLLIRDGREGGQSGTKGFTSPTDVHHPEGGGQKKDAGKTKIFFI